APSCTRRSPLCTRRSPFWRSPAVSIKPGAINCCTTFRSTPDGVISRARYETSEPADPSTPEKILPFGPPPLGLDRLRRRRAGRLGLQCVGRLEDRQEGPEPDGRRDIGAGGQLLHHRLAKQDARPRQPRLFADSW